MIELRQEIIECAQRSGASRVGFASVERLRDAPPSADASDLLPTTRTAISFAIPLDSDIQRRFLAKQDRIAHCQERKDLARQVYAIGDALVELLRGRGHDAVAVDVNNVYRPEEGARDITEMTEFHPDFSHRYAAIAAGVGRLGWSGNLLTPEQGAMVELGTVLTSAELEPSPLLEENPCDRCKLCSASCPVGMIGKKASITVRVAGVVDEIAEKQPNTCCWIGCTGYQGLAQSGRWSNWSPYRLPKPLPSEKEALDATCIDLQKADPQMQLESNSFSDYRAAIHDPDWFFSTVCGHCRGICWSDHADRKQNVKLLREAGVVGMTPDGVAPLPKAELVEVPTPYGVNVAVQRGYEKMRYERAPREMSPLDAEVFRMLFGCELPRS